MKTVLRCIAFAVLFGYVGGNLAADEPENAWDVRPVLVGTAIPDISVVGEDGKSFSVRDRAKEKPLVLVVYRGLW